MKIDLRSIPAEGLHLKESSTPEQLEINSKDIKFKNPIEIEATVTKYTNAVTAEISLRAEVEAICSRCLETFKTKINKKNRFDYSVSDDNPTVDVSEDIRQDLILDYPIKRLCKNDCKGLCPKCGENLNQGPCNCKKD